MKLTYQDVEHNIASLANRNLYTADFIYELLDAYGRSKSSITQLRAGVINKATDKNTAVLQKDVVYYKVYPEGATLEEKIVELENDPLTQRYRPRYLIATDLKYLTAKDTKKNDLPLSIDIKDIDNEIEFFWAWTGNESYRGGDRDESHLDRQAADRMKELYAEIEKENLSQFAKDGSTFRHDLNVFFSRLLFCMFAEDTGLFAPNQFTSAIKNFSTVDGSDLNVFFTYLFKKLDSRDKAGFSTPFSDFPYVDGTIFNIAKHGLVIPRFNAQARHLIIECARSNWGEINPDIFGTIFQGIVDPEKRDHNGMDYTSVPNIMKVIEPLFLDELHQRFDEVYNTPSSLRELLSRIRNIKVFDPACGSGNFLIIAYKQLRLLENAVIARLEELKGERRSKNGTNATMFDLNNIEKVEQLHSSEISLNNFYGIEIDDFASEMAILSLYIAQHQMDSEFEKQFTVKLKHLPLIENKNIVKANAARIDWNDVCPNNGTDEIYLIGNPPYKGSAKQTVDQKSDFKAYFANEEYSKNLDYIAIWFIKGARYISGTKAQLAFVSTNSVCQGEHVGIMFPKIFEGNVEIGFAYTSFKWKNSARDNAGVTVAIINLRNSSNDKKYIFIDGIKSIAKNINAYLTDSSQDYILPASRPISDFPEIKRANALTDNNNFNLTNDQVDELDESVVKYYYGAEEFINNKKRPILWLSDQNYEKYKDNPVVKEKVNAVREFRLGLKSSDGIRSAATPWLIKGSKSILNNAVILPRVSSERRKYIPMGYLGRRDVIGDSAIGAYNAELWLFALLESKMHMAWIRTVCGQLETRIRYSSTLGYNTFPVPPLTDDQKTKLSQSARNILLTRENHSEKTLAEMYDPNKMPDDLREAHDENDILVDHLYRNTGFRNDEERLAVLFGLYQQMINYKK